MSRRLKLPLAAGLIALTTACAGGTLSRIFSRNESLPQDVPKEMQEKFEVRDEALADSKTGQPARNPGAETVKESTGAGVGGPAAQPAPGSLSSVENLEAKRHSRHKRRKRRNTGKFGDPDSFVGPLQPAFIYPKRRPAKDAIWVSEKMVYDISYLGVPAATFTLETLPFKFVGDRRVYHVRGTAHTSKVFSIFYKLDDSVETFIDYEGIFSHRFHVSLVETKQVRDSVELYDSEKARTFYWNRWERPGQPKVETKTFKKIDPFSQDTLSSLYYLRSVPLPPGGVVDFPVVSEGNTVYAHVTVVRRETIDSPMGKVRCVVIRPEAQTHGVMTKKGDSFLWLTDDDRRILVRLEAKVKIGTLVANLREVDLGTPSGELSSK